MAPQRVGWGKRITLRGSLVLGVALVILLSFLAIPALGGGSPVLERVMVAHQPGATGQAAANRAIQGAGGRIVEWVPYTDIVVALVPEPALAGLVRSPGVLAVEPAVRVQIVGESVGAAGKVGGLDVAAQSSETVGWNITRIGAEAAWTGGMASVGRDVNVAILDTGIDLDHPDLVDNIEGGYGAIQAGSYDDDHNHGTHVAGIVAAVNNDIGVVGVAPAADLWAVKVLDQNGGGYLWDIIEGIRWAIDTHSDGNLDNDIQVINMSFGTTYNSGMLAAAVADAALAGIVLVAAAGNNGPSEDTVLFPAAYPSVVAVGATDQQDAVASFSSRGYEVELSAPGVSILSTVATGGYQAYSGTSMASPHVTGAAALILQADPLATPVDVYVDLAVYAEDLGPYGHDSGYGWGLVRPDRSLDAMAPPEPNMAPVAVDDNSTTVEDTAVVVDVLANDSDADGDLLTVTSVTDPVHGTAVANTDSTITYSPDVNYYGPDSFDYVVSDGNGGTDIGTVTINVNPVNDAPVAVDDSATTGEDTAVVVDVLANDSDVDGDDLSVESVTDPSHGAAAIDPAGTITYTPDTGYSGPDSFNYVVSDGNGGADTATITIEVTGAQANYLHVAGIEMDIKKAGRNVSALATVKIVDAQGNPVVGALVSGVWSGSTSDQDSGVTDVVGKVTLESNKTKSRSATFTFTVTNVVLDGWTYDSSANVVVSGTATYTK